MATALSRAGRVLQELEQEPAPPPPVRPRPQPRPPQRHEASTESLPAQCFRKIDAAADQARTLFGRLEDAKRWLNHATQRADDPSHQDTARTLHDELTALMEQYDAWSELLDELASHAELWKNDELGHQPAELPPVASDMAMDAPPLPPEASGEEA
jgi:hypothetical protein